MGRKDCPETSIGNYHSALLHVTQARRLHLHCGGGLMSRKGADCLSMYQHHWEANQVPAFYGIRSSITAVTAAPSFSIPWARGFQSATLIPCYFNPLNPVVSVCTTMLRHATGYTLRLCVLCSSYTNSDYFTVQRWLVGFYNWDGVCSLCVTDCMFISQVNFKAALLLFLNAETALISKPITATIPAHFICLSHIYLRFTAVHRNSESNRQPSLAGVH